MENDFVWTDDLVKEFVLFYNSINDLITGADPILKKQSEFKKSKEKDISKGSQWLYQH